MKPLLHPQTELSLKSLIHRPKGAYIFYGREGNGKMATLRWLMKAWHGHPEPAANCQRCLQIETGAYPDMIIINPEKDSIGIAQIQSLQQRLNLSRHDTIGLRTIIINQADTLTPEAQNALLKSAEEPPENTIIVLLAVSLKPILVTLQSRCQSIRFLPLSKSIIAKHLIRQTATTPERAQIAAEAAAGMSITAMRYINEPGLLQQYHETGRLVEQLCSTSLFEGLKLAAQLAESKTIPLSLLTQALQDNLREQLRAALQAGNHATTAQTTNALKASVRFTQQLGSHVPARAALSALVLELHS